MPDPIAFVQQQITTTADAIRWACVLEATAPKVGNVHPGRSFDTLQFGDFVTAAQISSETLTQFDLRMSQRMLKCVQETRQQTGTNVNLGIVLLLGPLVHAWQRIETSPPTLPKGTVTSFPLVSIDQLHRSIAPSLDSFDLADGGIVLEAIRVAGAGGLDQVDQMDVHQRIGEADLIGAMRLAADRDRIALQYANQFRDLFEVVVPTLSEAIRKSGDLLHGISQGHLRLLAMAVDSLIARKNGDAVAQRVQQRAGEVDPDDPHAVMALDQWLRSDSNRLNPGTTADLIAAALFVLLVTNG